MQPTPKYRVGEDVILQSPTAPEYSGEYVVEEVLPIGSRVFCRMTGVQMTYKLGSNPVYRLYGLLVASERGQETFWLESSLRKKHQPGSMPFRELVVSLNSSINEEQV